MLRRALKWLAISFAVVVAAVLILFALPNWNALRDPIARVVAEKTGRELRIGGDLKVRLAWPPAIRIGAADVSFANPPWATRKNMLDIGQVAFHVELAPLFGGDLVFADVRLDRAEVDLEKSVDGRKNWLLDREQRDEKARAVVKHVSVSDGRVAYSDPATETSLRARVATARPAAGKPAAGLRFDVEGRYKGAPIVARGSGESVLGLREQQDPYRLAIAGRIGQTRVSAAGRITNLLKPSAVDLQIELAGTSLGHLYPLIGTVFPRTPPYETAGRLIHRDSLWRYENFRGRVGKSDVAGTLQVDRAGERPVLAATLRSEKLDLGDLGPVIGGSTEPVADRDGSVLPDRPFSTERWRRMDADVRLTARSIARPDALPIDNLTTRLRLDDGVLALDPLKFDAAGGTLAGTIRLDGRQRPIDAAVDLEARKMQLARLFPAADIKKANVGRVSGTFDLAGKGDSVADMLGNADGKLALVVDGGTISRFMMEAVGLHLLEMLQLTLTGDEIINIDCGVADFGVKDGVMQARNLVLDTDVVRIDGRGTIDLGEERLDLEIVPKSKKLRVASLRTPIHVEGRFAKPDVGLDKGKLALRGLGALALGIVNPALALAPLIEANTAEDSACRRLIAEARQSP